MNGYSTIAKIISGVVLAALISWGAYITVATFNVQNSRFTNIEGSLLQDKVQANTLGIAVQDQRFRNVEGDIREIKESILRMEAENKKEN